MPTDGELIVIEIKAMDDGRVLHTFEGESLREAVLDAVAQGISLGDANLGDAYLRAAYLRGANLGGANLVNAYLHGANLRGANLVNANLANANLRDAKGIIVLFGPHGWAFICVETDDGPLIYCGCRGPFTFEEARKWWSPSHAEWDHRTYMFAYIDAAEAMAKAHGWLS